MAQFDVGKVTVTAVKDIVGFDYSVAPVATDAAQNQDETEWQNGKATTYRGYYKKIPEFKNSVNALATWTLGRGFQTDPDTQAILDAIIGWGEDTFHSIMWNMLVTKKVMGDAFAEIIRSSETGEIINIKPLDSGSIKIVVNREGKIKRYEQVEKVGKEKKVVNKFNPNEILHICNDRIEDEIHGVSLLEAVETIILMKNEAMTDRKTVFHRNVNPMRIIYVDTDNQAKIDELKTKYHTQLQNKEVMIVPMDTMRVEIPQVSIIDSEGWIKYLDNAFYEAVGVPKVILGGSQEFTEASSKTAYLTFEQIYAREQNELEADLWNQLAIRLIFNKPVSLKNELFTSEQKNTGQVGFQPNDTMMNSGKA